MSLLAARGAESITLLACFFYYYFSFLLDSVYQIFSSVRLWRCTNHSVFICYRNIQYLQQALCDSWHIILQEMWSHISTREPPHTCAKVVNIHLLSFPQLCLFWGVVMDTGLSHLKSSFRQKKMVVWRQADMHHTHVVIPLPISCCLNKAGSRVGGDEYQLKWAAYS